MVVDFALSMIALLNDQVKSLYNEGKYKQAIEHAIQSRELVRQYLGENNPSFALALNNLGELYRASGNYTEAEQCHQQALKTRRIVLEEEDPDIAESLNNLGGVYHSIGNYEAAEANYREANEILRSVFDKKDTLSAISLGEVELFIYNLSNLGELNQAMGNYTIAEENLCEVIEFVRQVLGENHPYLSPALNTLGDLYRVMGNFRTAEKYLRQALEINKVSHESPLPLATTLNNLAILYQVTGKFHVAENYLRQALKVRLSVLGKYHHDVAISLHNLGQLYFDIGNYPKAERLYRLACDIFHREKLPYVTKSLNNLARLHQATGNYTEAERLLEKVLEIKREVFSENHPDFAVSLVNLAALHHDKGDYDSADSRYRQAEALLRKVFGGNHHFLAQTLRNRAMLYAATGHIERARVLMEEASKIEDWLIGQVFSFSSESERMAYLMILQRYVHGCLSLALASGRRSTKVRQLALDLVLRRKALGAEALAVQRDAVLSGRYPALAAKLRNLATLRTKIGRKTLAGPVVEDILTYQQELAQWNFQREQLEVELARQIPEIRLERQLRVADRQLIADKLPEGAVIVEFIHFDVFDFRAIPAHGESRWKPARYLAFVLPAGDRNRMQMIDMGDAKIIDDLIAAFLALIAVRPSRRTASLTDAGIALRTMLFDPLLPALDGCTHLFLSPDGELSRLPFEVLPTADGRYLIDDYHLSYLSTGRDVLRFDSHSRGQSTLPLVVANPDFDLHLPKPSNTAVATATKVGRQSRDLDRGSLYFPELSGTLEEGEYIANLLQVTPCLDQDVLESRLKACQSPRLLHLATHGFFLPNQHRHPNHELAGLRISQNSPLGRFSDAENPLLRSGLALAGANTWQRGEPVPADAEDGMLTAEDVTGMDLSDTELVVLSACNTALGDVLCGEGVFGLRRAFVLAGAKTLVMSLWKIPDRQTRDLMQEFYRQLNKQVPRSEALRKAQRALKSNPTTADPYFWGAFICQGDPGPL